MDRTKPVAVASTKTNGTRPAKQNAQKWQRARQAPDPKFPPSRHPWKPYVRSRSTPPGSTRLQDECITLRGTRSFYHPDELRFPIHTTYEDRTVQPRHQGLSRGPYSRAGHSRAHSKPDTSAHIDDALKQLRLDDKSPQRPISHREAFVPERFHLFTATEHQHPGRVHHVSPLKQALQPAMAVLRRGVNSASLPAPSLQRPTQPRFVRPAALSDINPRASSFRPGSLYPNMQPAKPQHKVALPSHTKPDWPRDAMLYHLPRPVPTSTYMSQTMQKPTPSPHARRLLVVLDLNGVLVYRKDKTRHTPRPGLRRFKEYLFKHHNVMVWSSATRPNVTGLTDAIFTKDERRMIVAVWDRFKLRLTTKDYALRVQVYKQLTWVWDALNNREKRSFNNKETDLPNKGPKIHTQSIRKTFAPPKPFHLHSPQSGGQWDGEWNQTNTILIDDSFEKAAAEPHNLLEIEEFTASPEQKLNDKVLDRAIEFLEVAKWNTDVSSLIRSMGDAAKMKNR